jgi:hypothetical protein
MKTRAIILTITCAAILTASAQTGTWVDISTPLITQLNQSATAVCPLGCGAAGVVVNRLTGDVIIGIGSFGLWRSTNQGAAWTRIDSGVVNAPTHGKILTGWAIQVDQDDPKRIAAFDLDGSSGYTVDGVHWKSVSTNGAQSSRGWDFMSVDWATQDAKVMLALNHETGGLIYKTTNGGANWALVSANLGGNPGAGTISMIGVMDATTFIYSSGSGISRSTDAGATWAKVSAANPQTRVPVLFKGKHYLGTATGLLMSNDKGATWQTQGASVGVYQGPFFGADENTMVVVGTAGIYKTVSAGMVLTRISLVKPNVDPYYTFSPTWFGCYSWDPVNDIVYATAETNPAFKYAVPPTGVLNRGAIGPHGSDLSMWRGIIRTDMVIDNVELFSLRGALLDRPRLQRGGISIAGIHSPCIAQIAAKDGTVRHVKILPNQ